MARAKTTILQRVVSWFTGSAGAAEQRRSYEGGRRNRHTDGWQAGSSSADGQIGPAVALLRERMRDLVRNNPHAAMAVQVLVNNMVGSGIRPRAKTGSKALNKKVDALWDIWSRQADAHGHGDVYGLMALAVREMIEGGDCFAVPHFGRVGNGQALVPLQIELREADHLDVGKNALLEGGGEIRDGIEYDAKGRRVALWLFDHHPGDNRMMRWTKDSRRSPLDRVAHLFERQRVQSRGVPWGAPSLIDMRHFDDWRQTELVRKKTEACLAGVVVSDEEPATGPDGKSLGTLMTDSEGNVVEEFTPGMIVHVRGATSFETVTPQATGGVGEWSRVQLHAVAAGFRVPFCLMTGDLKENNFASSRVGLNEFRRMVEMMQWTAIIPMLLEPWWAWFIQAAQLAGHLPERGDYVAEWAPPRFESVNPKQDVDADIAEVRAGFASPQMMIAKRGYDPAAVLNEWSDWIKLMDQARVAFDCDPRRVAKAGTAQPDAPAPDGADATPPQDPPATGA